MIEPAKQKKEIIMKEKVITIITMGIMGSFSLLWALGSQLTPAGETGKDDPDARINLNPAPQQRNYDDGRALGDILMTINLQNIGVPGSGHDNAGLTWDGTYLYLVNMYDNTIYVIDPTGPAIISTIPLPYGLYWGLGREQNCWSTEAIANICDEIGTSNYFSTGVSCADVSEWWTNGELWLLSMGGTNKLYKFSIPDGTLLDSLGDPSWTSTSQRGLSYDPHNQKFWLGGWNSNMVWEVDPATGVPTRQFPFNNVAGMAYDWQSSLHPSPVLWIATNEATNYLYMVDVDNPPVGIAHVPQRSSSLSLSQNAPNPVNSGVTSISYTIPANTRVTLTIHNVRGQIVKTLINARVVRGRQSVLWNCTDKGGTPVPSGVYFYRLIAGEKALTRKLMILR